MPPVDLVESIQRPRCPSSHPDVGGSLSEIRRAGGWGQLRMVMGYRAWNGPSSADAHSRQAQPRGGWRQRSTRISTRCWPQSRSRRLCRNWA